MQKFKKDVLLLHLLEQKGYELVPCLPYWLRITTPDKTRAFNLINIHSETLTRWAKRYAVYVTYGKNAIEIKGSKMNMTTDNLVQLSIGGAMNPTLPILRAMELMLTDRDKSYGLIRLADERQIVLNGGAGGEFLVGAEIDEATQWKRADYWHSLDLSEFNRDWRQQMTPNDGNWHEVRYRSFNPNAELKGDEHCDFEFISAYQLIDDGLGNLYQLGRNVDRVEISS